MELSSMDVERKTFDVARKGGFDREQVGEFLQRVARVLSKLESDLSVSQRHNNELMRRLTRAQAKAEEGSRSFLYAAEMKQKLLDEAEKRAAEILEAAYAEGGVDDPAAAAAADLHAVRRRIDADAGNPADRAPSMPPVSAQPAADARAEAERILAAARAEATSITEAARAQAAEAAAEAQKALSAARSTSSEGAGNILAEAEAEARRIIDAGRARGHRLEKEGAEKAMELAAEAEREIAELREQVAGEHAAATAVREEAERLLAEASEDREAARTTTARAEELLEQAESRRSEADRTLARAEARLEATEAEAKSMLEVAAADASATRSDAAAAAEETANTARARYEQLVDAATRDAAAILSEAGAEAAEVLRSARARHKAASERLRDLDTLVEEIRNAAADARAGRDDQQVVVLLEDAREAAAEIEAEIWLTDEVAEGAVTTQESRYARRSAGLPRLGDEKSSTVLSDMGSLRRGEDKGKKRKTR